jgi:hypothetical protein
VAKAGVVKFLNSHLGWLRNRKLTLVAIRAADDV